MFDPNTVQNYRIFHGDAVHTLLNFKPNSIHSGFATPDRILEGTYRTAPWADFFGYRAQLFQLLYETLREDGSFFMTLMPRNPDYSSIQLEKIMEEIGWIRQHDTGFGDAMHCMHWTKSDNYYKNADAVSGNVYSYDCLPDENSEPLVTRENFEQFRDKTNASRFLSYDIVEDNRVNEEIDAICHIYTPPGGITLDPTAGTGRHLVAALQRGRRTIGIERKRMEVTISARRLARLVAL